MLNFLCLAKAAANQRWPPCNDDFTIVTTLSIELTAPNGPVMPLLIAGIIKQDSGDTKTFNKIFLLELFIDGVISKGIHQSTSVEYHA